MQQFRFRGKGDVLQDQKPQPSPPTPPSSNTVNGQESGNLHDNKKEVEDKCAAVPQEQLRNQEVHTHTYIYTPFIKKANRVLPNSLFSIFFLLN